MTPGVVAAAKRLIRRLPPFRMYQAHSQRRAFRRWIAAGRPVPPPHLAKQLVIKEYAAAFRTPVFVESGTYLGDMVNAIKDCFEEVYSIELSVEMYREAARRFRRARNVTILQGDSGEVLAELLTRIDRPSLFWLDGHYSAGITARGELETPIVMELGHVLKHTLIDRHVVLIDDARCFTGCGDYPTLNALRELALAAGLDSFEVRDDIVRMFKRA